MAYERYERGGWRDEQSSRDRDRRDRETGRYGARDHYRDRDERGFFERAGDEISSWFGDDDAQRRRRRDERMDDPDRSPRAYGRDEGRSYGRDRDRFQRDRDEDSYARPMNWSNSDRDYETGYDRPSGRRDYRPVTGDYGRSGGERGPRETMRSGNWDRDDYRRTSFAGSSASSQFDDPHYENWRRRRVEELDRDYNEYRRENESRFEDDFSSWRERRQGKRQLLGQVREHMDVVGSDNEHVGTVDRVAGDRIILTKSDPESGGAHHSISCTNIDRVEDKVILDMDADKAKQRWRDESRDRALFEREDQGEAGPHILDRSFSGTYR